MSVKGSSVLHKSAKGFCDMYRSGAIILEAVPVKNERKDANGVVIETLPTKLYNVYELVGTVRKDLYFLTPSPLTRPFVEGKEKCVIQNWDCSSCETDEPEEDDVAVMAYDQVFEILAEVVAKAAGVDADLFPAKFVSQSREGEACMWFDTPSNNVKSTNPWTFSTWNNAPGFSTMRVTRALVQTASRTHRGEVYDNHISIRMGLGRWKHDPSEKPKQIAIKRKATEVAAIVEATTINTVKKRKPSAAALAMAAKSSGEEESKTA